MTEHIFDEKTYILLQERVEQALINLRNNDIKEANILLLQISEMLG